MVLSAVLAVGVLEAVPAQASPSSSSNVGQPVTEDSSAVQQAAERASARAMNAQAAPDAVEAPAPADPPAGEGSGSSSAPADGSPTEPADPAQEALADASAEARSSKTPVVVEEATTASSQTVAHPDGTFSTSVSAQPERFKDDAGDWRPLDLSLPSAGGRRQASAADDSSGRVADRSGATDGLIQSGSAGSVFSWGPVGMVDVAIAGRAPTTRQTGEPVATADPTVAAYPDALSGGRDVVVRVTATGAEESVIVPTRAALGSPTGAYRDEFTVPAGVTAQQVSDAAGMPSGVEFVDSSGALVATFDKGAAHETVGPAGADGLPVQPAVAPVAVRLVSQAGSRVTVEMSVAADWLADPARIYPVTIDPWFTQVTSIDQDTNATKSYATYDDEAFPNQNYWSYDYNGDLQVGLRQVTNTVWAPAEALLYFDVANTGFVGSENQVTSANLSLYNSHSSTCQPRTVYISPIADGWYKDRVTWTTTPGTQDQNVAKTYSHGYSGCGAAWEFHDIKPIAQSWANGDQGYYDGYSNLGLLLTADEGDWTSYKRFGSGHVRPGEAPHLNISWENCTYYNNLKVCGAIRNLYTSFDGPWGALGMPTDTERAANVGGGYYNDFQNGFISWSPDPSIGTHAILGALKDKWRALGGLNSVLGYPITDELWSNGGNPYNNFKDATLIWSAATGAHYVKGALRDKWNEWGSDGGRLGMPMTDEQAGPGGVYYNDFQRGSVYWRSGIGAHAVLGTIWQTYAANGGYPGWLGMPTSEERQLGNGDYQQDFEGGRIIYDPTTRAANAEANGVQLTQPARNQRAGRRIPIAVAVDSAWVSRRTKPQLQYRRGAADSWKPINLATVYDKNGTPLCSSNCTSAPMPMTADGTKFAATGNVVYWDAGLQLDGVGGVLDARVLFTDTTGQQAPTAPVFGVTYDPNSGQSGTAAAGPGTVNLLTGELSLSDTDASAFGVSISRDYGSRSTDAGSRDKADEAFGPQWRMGGVAETADADYTQVKRTSPTSRDVVMTDGSTISYTRSADNASWIPEPGAEAFKLSADSADTVYTLTDTASGVVTSFAQVAGSPTDVWTVSEVNPVTSGATGGKTRYQYQSVNGKLRLTRVAALNPALNDATATRCVTDPIGSLPAGCRVLAPVWSDTVSTTDASGATKNVSRVVRIDLYATDPATPMGAPVATQLATYTYDKAGYLTQVSDPRPGITGGSYPGQTALTTTYTYESPVPYPNALVLDANTGNVTTKSVTRPGRLATVADISRQPWTFTYARSGPAFEVNQPGADGRIVTVARPTLTPGSVDDRNGTASTNIVYGVPLTKAAGGAQDLSYAVTRWWGQEMPPTDATAVFPTNAPSAASVGDHWASDDTVVRDWASATVSYLDVNGRTVNTATPVAGGIPAIDVTQYSPGGNPTFALTEGNRAIVMGQDDPAVVAGGGQRATDTWGALGLPTTALPADLTASGNDQALADAHTRADA
ncbi:hypothetical protein AB0J00_07350, partial [Modestobacter sp. NPDC049651]